MYRQVGWKYGAGRFFAHALTRRLSGWPLIGGRSKSGARDWPVFIAFVTVIFKVINVEMVAAACPFITLQRFFFLPEPNGTYSLL